MRCQEHNIHKGMGVQLLRQVQKKLSAYSADLFGVCSALYELGGLIVMHDASGCNSTYNTHDEPRWYDIDSMVFVSGLIETDAVLGNDDRLIDDICEAASETDPAFIAVSGSPVTSMMGTDFRGIGRVIEKKTGIPTIAFKTGCMNTYQLGAGQAFEGLCDRFCLERTDSPDKGKIKVNLLGVTPLDFSVVGNVEALRKFCDNEGFEIICCMAMGSSLDDVRKAGNADVNICVSSTGIPAAIKLYERFGTPFVTGIPVGDGYSGALAGRIRELHESKDSKSTEDFIEKYGQYFRNGDRTGDTSDVTWVIGEPVFASSVRECLERDHGIENVRIICPLEKHAGVLRECDIVADEEEDIKDLIVHSRMVIGDTFYGMLLPPDEKDRFVDLPHEAFSGRCFRSRIPVFVGEGFNKWFSETVK